MLIPDADEVISCTFLGAQIVRVESVDDEVSDEELDSEFQPPVNSHTGVGIANNIWTTTSHFVINSENYVRCSFNGQYHHLKVSHHLNEKFGLGDDKKPADWDPIHKAGLVDIHLRK